jgi:putative RecB family exonuclease
VLEFTFIAQTFVVLPVMHVGALLLSLGLAWLRSTRLAPARGGAAGLHTGLRARLSAPAVPRARCSSTAPPSVAARPRGRAVVATFGVGGELQLSGDTFPIKDGLKALRFRWDPAARCWALPPQPDALVSAAVLARVGELAASAGAEVVVVDGGGGAAPQPATTGGGAVADPNPLVAPAPAPSAWTRPPAPAAPAPRPLASPPLAPARPAVLAPARLPAALSVSALEAWRQCPLLFRFRYVDKLPSPPSPEMAVGVCAHSALQRLFEDLPPAARDAAALGELVEVEWAKLLRKPFYRDALARSSASADSWLAKARGYTLNYLALEAPAVVRPIAIERKLTVTLGGGGGVAFTGVLDRLDRATAGGGLSIVDYKTGKPPSQAYSAATNFQILRDAFFQLRVYALLAARDEGVREVPRELRLLFLQTSTTLDAPHHESELAGTEHEVLTAAAEIAAAAASHAFPPRTGKLCDWCAFKHMCPAFHPDVQLGPPTTVAE